MIIASFQAKIGGKRLRKRENKKLTFRFVPTRRVIKNYNKIAKKLKKYHYGFNYKIRLLDHFNRK